MARLSEEQIRESVGKLRGWEHVGSQIRKQYEFPSFRDAIAFVNRVAEMAEQMDHHPDITIEYRKVTLSLTSHDVGGLSDRDFRLATRIDA